MSIHVNDKDLCTDKNGFLCNFDEWEPAVADTMARNDGIVLTDLHWEVLRFLRSYYDEYEIAPDFRMMAKSLSRLLGADKASRERLVALFSHSPEKAACRYAGLPKPVNGACV
jgi:tRNA 2-thiouridine synthesizing protein E